MSRKPITRIEAIDAIEDKFSKQMALNSIANAKSHQSKSMFFSQSREVLENDPVITKKNPSGQV